MATETNQVVIMNVRMPFLSGFVFMAKAAIAALPACILLGTPGTLAPGLAAAGQPDESGSYYPQELTAQDLLYACASSSLTSRGRERQRYCTGFISGVEETIRFYGTGESTAAAYCFPRNMNARNYGDIFIRYASRKGTDTGRPAVVVVQEAFMDAFSCDRPGSQDKPH